MIASQSEKLTFLNAKGHQLAGRLEMPYGIPRSFAIFAHCFTCSKSSAAASVVSKQLTHSGIAVLRFDFTGLGNSEGDFSNTNFSSNVEDLVAAAGALAQRGHSVEVLIGHSLGGAAVIMAAHQLPSVKAVVTLGAPFGPQHVRHFLADKEQDILENGFANVSLGGRDFTIQKQFLEDIQSPQFQEKVSTLGRALLICHGPFDQIVSIHEAAKLFQAAKHPKSFLSLDSADHLLSRREDSRYAANVIAAWADKYVSAESSSSSTPEKGHVRVDALSKPYGQRIVSNSHVWHADEPKELGGEDIGPSPYDLLLSSLGACTSMTLKMYANRKGWDLQNVSVTLKHTRIHAKDCADCSQKEGYISEFQRSISIQGNLDPSQRARLLEIANRCPVHRSLENEIRIRTNLEP